MSTTQKLVLAFTALIMFGCNIADASAATWAQNYPSATNASLESSTYLANNFHYGPVVNRCHRGKYVIICM